jgi:hypothetical protein
VLFGFNKENEFSLPMSIFRLNFVFRPACAFKGTDDLAPFFLDGKAFHHAAQNGPRPPFSPLFPEIAPANRVEIAQRESYCEPQCWKTVRTCGGRVTERTAP